MRSVIIPPTKDKDGRYWLETYMPRIEQWFNEAAEKSGGQYTARQLAILCVSGQDRLWTFWDDEMNECYGAGTVTLVPWGEDGKVALVRWVAGKEWATWEHFLGEVEEWIREQGVLDIIAEGRKGWAKRLPDWKIRGYVFHKDLR